MADTLPQTEEIAAGPTIIQPVIIPDEPNEKLEVSQFTGCMGGKRVQDSKNYQYTSYYTYLTFKGKFTKWACLRRRKEKFKCSGYVITSEDLVVQKKEKHCFTCLPSTILRNRAKQIEQKTIEEMCKGAENTGSVF